MNLNINVAGDDETSAPFGYIDGATIKNLHITGSETTAGKRFASIAGRAKNSTIENCQSEVALTSSRANWVDGGAIVGRVEGSTTLILNGYAFSGSITYSNANGYEGGGMIGWLQGGASVTLNNCLFAPTAVDITKYDGPYMFAGGDARATLNNCYYNDVAAATSLTVEGKRAYSITTGDGVTIGGVGDGTGIMYNDVCYASNEESVSLTLSHAKPGYTFSEYTASAGTLSGTTLTMPDADVIISAEWTKNTKTLDETAADNLTWLTENNGQIYEVTLTRTLQAGGYNTFAVPFDISASELMAKGITVKVLTGSTLADGVLTLNFADAETIEAGKPYLVKVSANVENPTFEGVTVSNTTTVTEIEAVNFIPTLGLTTLSGDVKSILFLGSGNTLLNPSAENPQIKGFRAYFQLTGEAAEAGVKSFQLNFGSDETTGIKSIDDLTIYNLQFDADGWYTLDGRRLQGQPMQKGIYIVNGKKTIIKYRKEDTTMIKKAYEKPMMEVLSGFHRRPCCRLICRRDYINPSC